MHLFIAAVQHDDALGRVSPRRWLYELRCTCPNPPAFIGVEYAEDGFEQIRRQRASFANLAKCYCPGASAKLLRALAKTIAYEADAHIGVFRQPVQVLWLDQYRDSLPDEDAIRNFAEIRLQTSYRHFWKEVDPSAKTSHVLSTMSRLAWDRSDQSRQQDPPTPTARDEEFAQLIIERVQMGGEQWATVVVGRNHATDAEGFMLRQLLDAGIQCHVEVLDPRT
jgi:hypothetical protein